jgi:small-conductance mechanosensitive channel
MEDKTRKIVKYLLWEFVIFFVLVMLIFYFNQYIKLGELMDAFILFLPKIIIVVLVVVITKLILSLMKPAFEKAFEPRMRSHADTKMMWQFFANMVWIFIIVVLILVVIGSIETLLPFAVILAALIWVLQKPILNIVGWTDIIFRRPYAIGDRIEIDEKKGYVVDVGMLHTTLREFGEWMEGDTFTGRLITLPNSKVLETPVINYTRDTHFLWDEIKVSITYESDHDVARQHILEAAFEVVGNDMMKASQLMAKRLEINDLKRDMIEGPIIRMELSESCLNFFVIYSCEASKRRAVRSDITIKILNRIKNDDRVRIAYPHMEVVGVK